MKWKRGVLYGRPPVPGPEVIPNCVQVRLNFSTANGSWHMIIHGTKGSTTVDETLANSVATAIGSAVTSSGMTTYMAAGGSFDGVWVKDLTTANNASFESNVAGVPAAGATTPESEAVAICITKQTAKAGKEFRGRMYFGGLDGAAVADGKNMTGGAKIAAGNFGEAVRTALNGAGIPMVLAQRALQAGTDVNGNPLGPRAANTVPITRLVVRDNRLDSMRLRLGR